MTLIKYIQFITVISLIINISYTSDPNLPQTPVIGVYTQNAPNTQQLVRSFIPASYVKYLEMSGAQVVPIFYTQSTQSLLTLLNKINGVLFTGGSMSFNMKNSFTKNADTILKYAIQQNKKGNVFPVWGTCMGHQLLSYLTSGYDINVLSAVHGQSPIVNTLNILDNTSYLFKNWGSDNIKAATQKPGVLYFTHNWAVYTSYFRSSQLLSSFWNLVATTTSPYGQEFVSMQQAKQYPFYSTQFHPQKSLFEWKVDANRTKPAVQIAQSLSNLFVENARQNKNRYLDNNELYKGLIYNYDAIQPGSVYLLDTTLQIYIFDESKI